MPAEDSSCGLEDGQKFTLKTAVEVDDAINST